MGTIKQVPTGEECLYQGVCVNMSLTSLRQVLCMQQGPTWGCLYSVSSPTPQLHDPSSEELASGPTAGITPVTDSPTSIDL